MKFRLMIDNYGRPERPFFVQYKKFLFWHTFHQTKKEDDGSYTDIVPYFDKDAGLNYIKYLESAVNEC